MALDPRYYYTYRDLVNAGIHPEWALGATGNFGWETADFTSPRSKFPGENSAGYPHFNGDRLTRFNEYRSKHGNADLFDHNANIGFIIDELQTKFPGLWNKMQFAPKKGENPTMVFADEYERPGVPAYEGRIGKAESLRAALGRNQFADVPPGPVNTYQPRTPGMEYGVVPFNPNTSYDPKAGQPTGNASSEVDVEKYRRIWDNVTSAVNGQDPKAMQSGFDNKQAGEMPTPRSKNGPSNNFGTGTYGAQGGPNIWDMSMARAGLAGMENPAYDDYNFNKTKGKGTDRLAEIIGLASVLRKFYG